MKKSLSCGCVPIVGSVTDSLDAWSWKVGAHRRDAVGPAACAKREHLLSQGNERIVVVIKPSYIIQKQMMSQNRHVMQKNEEKRVKQQ